MEPIETSEAIRRNYWVDPFIGSLRFEFEAVDLDGNKGS